jgi:hypothetical protein
MNTEVLFVCFFKIGLCFLASVSVARRTNESLQYPYMQCEHKFSHLELDCKELLNSLSA